MKQDLHIVGFRVGRELYGVPIITVQEIVRVPEITAVPDAPAYVEGIINLRGKIVSIIDLRKRFGEKEITDNRRNRILVAESHGRLVGMIVDSATDVFKIPADEVEAPPDLFRDGGLNCVTGVGKHKGRLIVLLDTARLLELGGQTKQESSADTGSLRKKAARAGGQGEAANQG